jgi:hypothetical protein
VIDVSEIKTSKGPEDEQVLHRFSCSGTHTEFFELVFTSNRLIIAKTGGEPYLGVGKMLAASAKASKKVEELKKLSPGEILADNPENISMPYLDIVSVVMKRPGFLGQANVLIQARGASKWYEFRLALKKEEYQGHVDFVQSILKEKVIVR